jgi:hypothetical protein
MLIRRKPLVTGASIAILVGAGLLIANPKLLTGDAGEAGCGAVDDLVDKETAYGEARFLATEVMVTLALGLDRVDNYIATVEPLVESPVAVSQSNQSECYQATVLELEPPATGKLQLDYANCSDDTGLVVVAIEKEYPDLEDIELDPDAPMDPETGQPQLPDPSSIEPLSVKYELEMEEVTTSGVQIEGSVRVDEISEEERNFTTELSIDFLDYAGTLLADGSANYQEGNATVVFAGTFRSVTGLDWKITASDLVLQDGCSGAKSGSIIGTFENSVGEPLEVVSSFDGSCDGCANITVGGAEQQPICIPEMIAF